MLLAFLALTFAAGLGGGWFARSTWGRFDSPPQRVQPLPHDDYLARRERLDRAYTESMREYDRLVTWASGGALLVSVTFLEKLAPNPRQGTEWLLATGWALLVGALLLSLLSQYASSRIHSWRLRELNQLQVEVAARSAMWQQTANRLHAGCAAWGKVTKWTTFSSGMVLVFALVAVAAFAFQNTTFVQPKEGVMGNGPTETKPMPVPEKRSLEDIPEPVPRPAPEPPAEKK
jgi:hypothetical protein